MVARRGWAVVSGFLSPEETAWLRAAAIAAENIETGSPGLWFVDRSSDGLSRVARVERVSEVISGLAGSALSHRMIDLAERCLGGRVVLFKDKLNIRYPGSPGYAPHQDAARWDTHATRFVSVGLFLGASDDRHGGFEFAEVRPDIGRMHSVAGDLDFSAFEALPRTELRAVAGDAIVIEGDAPHRTFDNTSGEVIHHYLFTYAQSADPGLRGRFYGNMEARFASIRNGNVFTFPKR